MANQQRVVSEFPPLRDREPVTVAIPNYNGKLELADAIRSIRESTYRPEEILIVDDGSTDGSVPFIRTHFPEVRIVEMGRNTKMLNQVRNRALHESKTRLVLLMDHDVVITPTCLSALVSCMHQLPDAAVLTTRAVSSHDVSRIYVDVQRMHFLCNSVAFHRDGDISEGSKGPQPSVGWGTMLIDKNKASVIGFFDEDYVMGWGDDGEFHHKIHLVGLGCYSVPEAVVYHKRTMGAERIYGGIRNRWQLMIQAYAIRTLMLLSPALLLYEVALFTLLCLRGEWKEYLWAMRDVLRNLPRLSATRATLQKLRRVPDSALLVGGPIYIRGSLVGKRYLQAGLGLLNLAFRGYWWAVRGLL